MALTRNEIVSLAENQVAPCVSILMPVHNPPEDKQNSVRLRNALKKASAELEQRGAQADEVLGQLRESIEEASFWEGRQNGLAIFCAPGFLRHYHVPLDLEDLVLVGNHFHITPLLQVFSQNARFYVLALSQNQVRLFECSRYHVSEVPLPEGTPRSLTDAMKFEDPDRQIALNQTERGSNSVHHAHGQPDEKGKVKIREFCKSLDNGIRDVLREQKAPLVLACVEFMAAIYKDANTYAQLTDDFVRGNPEGLKPEELRQNAWAVVEPYLFKGQQDSLARFGTMSGNGLTSKAIQEIVQAAYGGRVGALFVAPGLHQWGTIDEDRLRVKKHDEPQTGDEDLLAVAALQTLLHGGDVYTVEQDQIPDNAPVAALFRY